MNAPDPTRALLAAPPAGHGLDPPQWRAVFMGMAVGMVVLDAAGAAVDANPAAEALLGLQRGDILGRRASELGIGPPGSERRGLRVSCTSLPPVQAGDRPGGVVTFVDVGPPNRPERGLQQLEAELAQARNDELLRALRAAAQEDSLTGLLNRNALHDTLQRQIEQRRAAPGTGLAVFFLDFDRFKIVNDTLGHNAGDELLRAIAERLRAVAQRRAASGPLGAWSVARFGGDEFVIVLPVAGAANDARGVHAETQAVLRALAEPYTVRQQPMHSSASIGIALWHAGVASADDMLRDADTAMYEAKRAGRGLAVLFDDTMRARLTRAAVIETELRHAVQRQQLEAVYQPIVDLETGAMTSVEALMRWQHPELGAVSPAEFIPVAEESGHIMVLGEWILRTACLQWTAWQRENAALAPALMSVNLSREQVTLGRRVITVVREALADAGMPPAALQLEITEREVMKSPEQARALLQELSAMGVKLAMDDFGTGTSSLGCLRDYPFDTIKIDKSFVTNVCRDPHVLAVAHATVNVIENLGMVSVAEGIEDPAEVAVLQAMGCRYGQGYLFARPQRPEDLLAAMATGSY